MSKKLLIVESPAKAKTIGKYLGSDFQVKSSVGHIRDLPKGNGAIKVEKTGDDTWEFLPTYEISEGKTKVVNELKDAVKKADAIYLASDPDREGEAIAWHLKETLAKVAGDKQFHRVTYNEITKSAVLKAVSEPREIDMPLVDAQQARRILDRLVGYKVSPLLWKNINCANNRTLSAGRVQSVALRLLVERQREIDAFKPEVYFLMGVEAKKPGAEESFVAKLSRLDGEKPAIKDRHEADNILLDLSGAELRVTDLKSQPKIRHALPPFTTSTLQQAASSTLGMSPGKTMKIAQSLYEHGFITYMRTDSVNVSDQARAACKAFIEKYCGSEYYPENPNFYKSKEAAQEAHEAIRPTDVELSPKRAEAKLESAEWKLYDLIWRRFVASQMSDAKTTLKTISLEAHKQALTHAYLFTASATTIDFEGFLKIMKLSLKKKTKDGEDDEDTDEVTHLPEVSVGESLEAVRWLADEKKTKGPVHYSEAALIKALEENGVGRPSTYAQTIETLKFREYAKTEKKKLVPLERGMLVCDWLVAKMDALFNVHYTAQMEGELDEVAEKGLPMNTMLSRFYAKFLKEINDSQDPPPPSEKFEAVFALLDQVKTWKPGKTVGKRVYDDRAFVQSVKDQAAEGKRPLSARQLEFLTRMAVSYSDQIPDCEMKLSLSGIKIVSSATVGKADPEGVKYCFDVMDRIEGIYNSSFMKSLKRQWEMGRGLSPKQFAIMAKSTAENCGKLEDAVEIRERLSKYIEGGIAQPKENPIAVKLFQEFDKVTEWHEPLQRGKRVYDDHEFVTSLKEQYEKRRSLSDKQISALLRLAKMYSINIAEDEENGKAE